MKTKEVEKKKSIPITIGDILTKEIESIIKEEISCDCLPTFKISCIRGSKGEDIILTLTHIGWSYSGIIEFETNVRDLVVSLYNQTL